MTAWTQQDYERADDRDTGQVTASPLTMRAEFEHGKGTAWQLTERSAEGGQSADHIAQRHMELSGPVADQNQRTPAEAAWHQGYKSGADGSVSLLRELERADQGQPERPKEGELEAG